jgi:acetylornithine deacetylase
VKDASAFLLDLVAIPSVSAMSNQPVIDYVTGRLSPRQWQVETSSYRDASGIAKTNLVALTRNAVGNHAELAFVCHTDTVPFQADWAEAVNPALRDGRIYGRGSCDVKGFLACVLVALNRIDLDSLERPLALILTADEEIGCIGAKCLAAQKAFSTRHMIIGEPTSLRPIRAGKGYALGTILVRGSEAHSALPATGRSATFDAGRVLLELEQLTREIEAERNPDFDPPFTTLNVGLIQGGTAKNIVPGECRLTVEWRPIPGQDPDWVAGLIRERLSRLRESVPGLNAELELQRSDPPFAPSDTQDLATLLTDLTGNAPGTIAFGSEAAHLRGLTQETIVFGPGDMATAHRTGEFVPVAELDRCVDYFETAIRKLACLPQDNCRAGAKLSAGK